MTDEELRKCIEQAHDHTRRTTPGPDLEKAKQHLHDLRVIQIGRALNKDQVRYECADALLQQLQATEGGE